MLRLLEIHPNAADDIRAIATSDAPWANKIVKLLQQLKSDEILQDKMLERDSTTDDGEINFAQIVSQRKNNMGRIKFLDIKARSCPYRIIYAFYPISPQNHIQFFRILAVVRRSATTYDQNSETIKRAITAIQD